MRAMMTRVLVGAANAVGVGCAWLGQLSFYPACGCTGHCGAVWQPVQLATIPAERRAASVAVNKGKRQGLLGANTPKAEGC